MHILLSPSSPPLPLFPPTPAHSLEKVNCEEMVADVSGTECQLTILVSLLSSCDTNFTILYHLCVGG